MRTTTRILVTALIAGTVVYAAGAGRAGAAADEPCADGAPKVAKDVPYTDDAAPLQTLDVYGFRPTKGCTPAPVVVWVHGGGWAIGDKRHAIADKARLFNGRGEVLVSVNYRLSERDDPDHPIHPAHAQDVGAAIAWVEEHIAGFGGDGEQLALLGHSAGGHLVSLVGLDPTYVEDAGGDIDAVRCVVSDDTEGYDLVERAAQGGRVLQLVQNAFGTDPSAYPGASPINHVADREDPPDFLVITRGLPRRVAAARAFADAVQGAGATVDVLEATGLTHADVNRLIGADGDTVVTPAVTAFLDSCVVDR